MAVNQPPGQQAAPAQNEWIYRIVAIILAVEIFADVIGGILVIPILPPDPTRNLLIVVFVVSVVWNAAETAAVMTLNLGAITQTGPRRYRAIFWSTMGTLVVLMGLVLLLTPLGIAYAALIWILRGIVVVMLVADIAVATQMLRGN